MKCKSLIGILLVLVALSSCSSSSHIENLINTSKVVVLMEKMGCFGSCLSYELMIFEDGTVVYTGKYFVEVEGIVKYSIPKEDVQELVDFFYEIDFFSMDDSYWASVTDSPSTTITITINDDFKSVYIYGWQGPESLFELEEKIDEIALTSDLIGKDD